MQKVVLKFKSIEAKPDALKSSMKVLVHYYENNDEKVVEKVLMINEPAENFAASLMKEIRTTAKNKDSTKSGNFLDNFVNIVVDERDIGETEEKIVAALKRLREQIRGFKNVKTADNYMNKFFDMSRLEIKL